MTTKAKRITWITVSAFLAALVIVITVFSFVRVNDGFRTGVDPFTVLVAKNGSFNPEGSSHTANSRTLNGANKNATDDNGKRDYKNYTDFLKNYKAMTSFSIMRGIVEGRWFPKAKLETTLTAAEVKQIRAENTDGYLVTMFYSGLQTAEIKVMKAKDKDETNVVIIGDDTFNEGAYVPFSFDCLVFEVTENNFINELIIYAFDEGHLKNNEPEFYGYKISVQANRIRLYNTCASLFV